MNTQHFSPEPPVPHYQPVVSQSQPTTALKRPQQHPTDTLQQIVAESQIFTWQVSPPASQTQPMTSQSQSLTSTLHNMTSKSQDSLPSITASFPQQHGLGLTRSQPPVSKQFTQQTGSTSSNGIMTSTMAGTVSSPGSFDHGPLSPLMDLYPDTPSPPAAGQSRSTRSKPSPRNALSPLMSEEAFTGVPSPPSSSSSSSSSSLTSAAPPAASRQQLPRAQQR